MPGTRDRRTRHRSAPRRSLRFSFVLPFVVPVVCLGGLWGYTAAGLVEHQTQLHTAADRATDIAGPAQDVLTRLQTERRLTSAWQQTRTDAARKDLDAARAKTDAAVQTYHGHTSSGLDTAALTRSAKTLGDALVFLPERRKAVDARTLSAADAFQYFTDTASDGIDLLGSAVRSDDGRLAHGGAATTSVVQLTEMLSREDALLAAALPADRLTTANRAQFTEYLAVQRAFRTGLNVRDLPGDAASSYARITDSAQFTTVGRVEDAVTTGQGTSVPPLASSWPAAAAQVTGDLQALGADSISDLADSASSRGDRALLEALIGTGATLLALAAGALLAVRFRRSNRRRITELQAHTEELSTAWLPQLLARVEAGERFDPETLTPQPGRHATDEVQRLAAAIDQLGHVAADTVVRQSLGREGTEKVFAQLIRRAQTLIHRLISLLDDLERKHEDSDLLKDIFKVDHLATRVRRHAENLVVLSGSQPNRRMTEPISIIDVMRSAVAETEQYTRVKVKNMPAERPLALAGRAVADVTHLLAELIENGTSFSPPDTQVFVSATKVVKGLAVQVEDHGLGMPQELLDQANDLLAHPPRLDMTALSEDPRLGHFVVARLAERHKIKVELRDSVYGGTLVVVLIPSELLEEVDSPVLDQLKSAAAASNRAIVEEARQAVAGAGRAVADVSRPVVTGAVSRVVAGTTVSGAETAAAREAAAEAPKAPEVSVIAGVVTSAGGDVHPQASPGHARVPDHSGFPEYGGAGLLPAASEHPTPAAGEPQRRAPRRERAEPAAAAGPAPQRGYAPPAGARQSASPYPAPQASSPYPSAQGSPYPAAQQSPYPAAPSAARPTPARGAPTGAAPGANPRTAPAASPAPGYPPAQEAHGPLTTPQVLPQRTRGASLAQQLRREAAYTQSGPDDGDSGAISPAASARAMIAIQQGLKRARMSEADEPGATDARPTDSRSSGAHQL